MVIFDFAPNWKSPVVDRYEYLTDILVSRDGSEQRRALRGKPRQTLRYNVLLEGADQRRFEHFIWRHQEDAVTVPHWSYPHLLVNVPATGSTAVLTLDRPVAKTLAPGSTAVLRPPGQPAIAVQIQTASDTGVTLGEALSVDVLRGAVLYPALTCVLPDTVSTKRLTARVLEATLTLQVLPDSLPAVEPSGYPAAVVGGREVFLHRVNWGKSPSVDYTLPRTWVDASVGLQTFESLSDWTSQVRKGSLLKAGRDEVDALLAFFDRMQGRAGEFVCPDWGTIDFLRTSATSPSGIEIRATGLGYDPAIHSQINVQIGDQYFLMDVLGFEEVPEAGVTHVLTAQPWSLPTPIESTGVAVLATNSRLAADALEVRWVTSGVAEIEVAVQTVPKRTETIGRTSEPYDELTHRTSEPYDELTHRTSVFYPLYPVRDSAESTGGGITAGEFRQGLVTYDRWPVESATSQGGVITSGELG